MDKHARDMEERIIEDLHILAEEMNYENYVMAALYFLEGSNPHFPQDYIDSIREMDDTIDYIDDDLDSGVCERLQGLGLDPKQFAYIRYHSGSLALVNIKAHWAVLVNS